ncbi:MAG TPA: acyl transferase, partial [Saprospirales bacterium]|nr:acyl transferase [Saprospirales bacterium]HRQ31297.1 acyl transferase [Saprospiraceae bacterium]
EVFKKHEVKTGIWKADVVFRSSGTTDSERSVHHLRTKTHYQENAVYCFENQFGNLGNYRFYGLLPSYIEQGDSSLVHMVNYFMQYHRKADGGFYLYDHQSLIQALKKDQKEKIPVLFGVSYALLDLAETISPDLNQVMVFETGGMKGRGKELAREELHQRLCNGLNLKSIYSEYGMTELLSQSYSSGEGIFEMSPSMKILISDLYDPKSMLSIGQHGRINVIDLANIDSCAFIATQDVGVLINDKEFSVLGRTDSSEIRGCNLLYV